MSKSIFVPIGMDLGSTEAGGYFAVVCCQKLKNHLEDIELKKANPFPDDYEYCPYCGEKL